MATSNYNTPGVYITETNALANAIVPVATAVPAFIGYTPQAAYEGKSYTNVPVKVSSFADFQKIFCYPDPPGPAAPARQYSPQYYLVQQKSQPSRGDYVELNGLFYSIVPDPNTIYYLYNSIRFFYSNGGGDAYIVSVGGYGPPSGKPADPGSRVVNPNVHLDELLQGLATLKNNQEPTMYICPEATLLSKEDNGTLMQQMLQQNQSMQTAMSIFDVIGGQDPDPILYINDIATFRSNTGLAALDYGIAYYPFIETNIVQSDEIDWISFFDNNKKVIDDSKMYSVIMSHVLRDINVLPPSGAMAGVITTTDNEQGVWQAPANTSIVGAVSLTINLSDDQQANLNVDPVTGKSINVIRFFTGQGILVWGARTLDGNSQDWRYINTKRTVIYIEQSCRQAAMEYVFEPNNKNTWEAVRSMISSFLTEVWSQGGLQGANASDAFSVDCGLGTTMTGEDIINRFLRVTVKLAVEHPAEFIVITFQQQMAQ